MDVVIVAFDGFTDIDVFLPWDLLTRVDTPGWRVAIVAQTPRVRSIGGLTIDAHGALEDAAEARAVIVASGPGLQLALVDPAFTGALRLDPQRQRIGSMCSGALLLARLGVLGPRATTYPTQRAALAGMGVEVIEQGFVREGNVATAAGCLAGVELAGWIIEELAGEAQREMVLRSVQPVGRGLSFDDARPLPRRRYAPA